MNWVFWLVMVIFLTIIEITTVNLVGVWFIASSLISLVISLFNDNFFLQFSVFVILGIVFLITTKPIINKYLLNNKKEGTNLDRVIGMIGIVTIDIIKNEVGEVKVDGKRWSAISTCDIKEGEYVVIDQIKGVKLVVSKKESDN